jgi:hypothetical protein
VTSRERVFDFAGGPLLIVEVVNGPTPLAPILWQPVEEVECLALGRGLAIPAKLVVPLYVAGDPTAVAHAEIGVIDGKPACIALYAIAPHELTMQRLRQLKGIGRAIRDGANAEALQVARVDGVLVGERHRDVSADYTGPRGHLETAAQFAELTSTPRARRSVDDEFLRQVSDVYRDAVVRRTSTQRAIQERWRTSDANARRWVAAARARGRETGDPSFLGEALGPLQAGEKRSMKGGRRGKTK